jgi:hypothetical protein
MTDYDTLVAQYIATWNETDAAALDTAVAELFSADARYVDPLVAAEGRATIAATIGAVHEQFPGFEFRLAGPVDGHHDQVRFTWELGQAGAEAPIVGFDVATLDGEGRITTVLGFLDKVPA